MNGIRCSRINEVRINLSAKIKVSNIIWAISRVGDSNRFFFGVEKADSNHVSNTENRVADDVGCCFRVPFGHCCTHIKYVATVVTKSIKEMGGAPAYTRIWRKQFSDEGYTILGALIETGTRVRMVASLAPITVN